MTNETLIHKISRIILQNQKTMIKEQDIINLCATEEDYQENFPEIVSRFKSIGLNIVRSTYNGEKFYVLTTPGKDSAVSPSMYGTMALIIALYNEIKTDIEMYEMKKLFKDVWEDVQSLISLNYLQIIKEKQEEKITITPIGKAAFKNVIKNLDLKSLLK